MSADLYLGLPGQEILLPSMSASLNESDFEITREDRTASGRLVKDVIAIKKKFEISYSILEDSEFKKLLELYALGSSLNFRLTDKDGTQRSYTVSMKPFSRQRAIFGETWYWQDVKVELEEI